MQPSSLILLAIVLVWAAYLVPHWVRRRDELSQSRGHDRFSSGLRVLKRRERSGGSGRSGDPLLTSPRVIVDTDGELLYIPADKMLSERLTGSSMNLPQSAQPGETLTGSQRLQGSASQLEDEHQPQSVDASPPASVGGVGGDEAAEGKGSGAGAPVPVDEAGSDMDELEAGLLAGFGLAAPSKNSATASATREPEAPGWSDLVGNTPKTTAAPWTGRPEQAGEAEPAGEAGQADRRVKADQAGSVTTSAREAKGVKAKGAKAKSSGAESAGAERARAEANPEAGVVSKAGTAPETLGATAAAPAKASDEEMAELEAGLLAGFGLDPRAMPSFGENRPSEESRSGEENRLSAENRQQDNPLAPQNQAASLGTPLVPQIQLPPTVQAPPQPVQPRQTHAQQESAPVIPPLPEAYAEPGTYAKPGTYAETDTHTEAYNETETYAPTGTYNPFGAQPHREPYDQAAPAAQPGYTSRNVAPRAEMPAIDPSDVDDEPAWVVEPPAASVMVPVTTSAPISESAEVAQVSFQELLGRPGADQQSSRNRIGQGGQPRHSDRSSSSGETSASGQTSSSVQAPSSVQVSASRQAGASGPASPSGRPGRSDQVFDQAADTGQVGGASPENRSGGTGASKGTGTSSEPGSSGRTRPAGAPVQTSRSGPVDSSSQADTADRASGSAQERLSREDNSSGQVDGSGQAQGSVQGSDSAQGRGSSQGNGSSRESGSGQGNGSGQGRASGQVGSPGQVHGSGQARNPGPVGDSRREGSSERAGSSDQAGQPGRTAAAYSQADLDQALLRRANLERADLDQHLEQRESDDEATDPESTLTTTDLDAARLSARVAARRRARSMTVLLVSTTGAWVFALVGPVPLFVPIAVTLLLAANGVASRTAAVRSRETLTMLAAHLYAAEMAREHAERRRQTAARLRARAEAEAEAAKPVPERVARRNAAVTGDTWDPVPVPKPTYQLKPAVHRRPPPPLEEPVEKPQTPAASDQSRSTMPRRAADIERILKLDEDPERPRAVNE